MIEKKSIVIQLLQYIVQLDQATVVVHQQLIVNKPVNSLKKITRMSLVVGAFR